MSGPFAIPGAVALVTGAAGGIGRAVAVSLAKRGADLALLDRRAAPLKETAALVEAEGRRASLHVTDMTDMAAVEAAPEAVLAAHGRLDILVNNAGVALIGDFEQVAPADEDWVMEINLRSVMRMTRACLPALRQAPEARIVNISSIFGVITPPGQTAYCASKFAVRGFSNALRYELAGSTVGVTVIHPGGIATDIAANARTGGGVTNSQAALLQEAAKKGLVMPPDKAGEIIVRAIERRRARRLVGVDAKILALLERLFPVNNYWVLEKLFPSVRQARDPWKAGAQTRPASQEKESGA